MVYDVVGVEEIPVFVHSKQTVSVRGTWFVCGMLQCPAHFVQHLHTYVVRSNGQYVAMQSSEMHDFQSMNAYKYASEEAVILTHWVVRGDRHCT